MPLQAIHGLCAQLLIMSINLNITITLWREANIQHATAWAHEPFSLRNPRKTERMSFRIFVSEIQFKAFDAHHAICHL